MKICTLNDMWMFTRQAEEQFHLSTEVFMEHVGMTALRMIKREIGTTNPRIVVLCGPGMSAGYGCAAARQIYVHGGRVQVYFTEAPEHYDSAIRQQVERVACLPIQTMRITSAEAAKIAGAAKTAVLHSDVVIDALWHPDTTEDMTELTCEIAEMLNASKRPIISLDLPCGIHADTGHVSGAAVRATCTLVCGIPKIGHLLYPGYEYCGNLYVTRMSLPPELTNADSLQFATNEPPKLPPRDVTGHKGTFGDVLVIAGAGNYYGAPYFSASAVLKAGAGYSRLAAPASVVPIIAAKGSELVFVPQQETKSGSIALSNKHALLELTEKVDMVILGPGLSLNEETQQLARDLAAAIEKPLLLDGDGITALCKDLSIVQKRHAETILTPHLGEMSRIAGVSVRDVAENPIPLLQRTSHELNAFIVLKGAHSLIGYPDGHIFVNLSGNSGMGTAGSGDVLTGTIAAMFGLGLPVPDAVRKGVFMHGLSGDLAAQEKGEDGITAQDILDFLPPALKLERETVPEELSRRYQVTLEAI